MSFVHPSPQRVSRLLVMCVVCCVASNSHCLRDSTTAASATRSAATIARGEEALWMPPQLSAESLIRNVLSFGARRLGYQAIIF